MMSKFLTKLLTYLKYAPHFVRNFNINLAFNTRLKFISYLRFALTRQFSYIAGIFLCLMLTGCTTISRQIQDSLSSTETRNPPAIAANPALQESPVIELSHYQSVEARPFKKKDLVIAVAASGGGYRAANLTLGVLLGLEKMRSPALNGNLLQEVDYFSTVSGSGFGVGYYLAQLHNHIDRSGSASSFSLQRNVQAMLARDCAGCINPLRADLGENLFFGGDVRGLKLEKKINDTVLYTPEGGLKLGDIFVSRTSGSKVQLPYWAANSTIYQNAEVFPFTPDILAHYQVRGYFHNGAQYQLRSPYSNPEYAYSVPASVGLTASISVPFAIPPTILISDGCREGEKQCYLQLYDGGLADNLGVYTALNFLLQDDNKIKVLIMVDAYKGNTQPFSRSPKPPESVALISRLMTMGTDSNREHIKAHVNMVTRDLLCGHGASNVVVVHLDLAHYPQALNIGTKLNMTAEHQKLLLKIGQELVLKDKELQQLLTQLTQNHVTLGQCGR